MSRPDPQPVYRYTGRRTGTAPFPGVPMRDLFPDDVERLPLALLRNATGGATPLYVTVKAPTPDTRTTPMTAADKPAEQPKE